MTTLEIELGEHPHAHTPAAPALVAPAAAEQDRASLGDRARRAALSVGLLALGLVEAVAGFRTTVFADGVHNAADALAHTIHGKGEKVWRYLTHGTTTATALSATALAAVELAEGAVHEPGLLAITASGASLAWNGIHHAVEQRKLARQLQCGKRPDHGSIDRVKHLRVDTLSAWLAVVGTGLQVAIPAAGSAAELIGNMFVAWVMRPTRGNVAHDHSAHDGHGKHTEHNEHAGHVDGDEDHEPSEHHRTTAHEHPRRGLFRRRYVGRHRAPRHNRTLPRPIRAVAAGTAVVALAGALMHQEHHSDMVAAQPAPGVSSFEPELTPPAPHPDTAAAPLQPPATQESATVPPGGSLWGITEQRMTDAIGAQLPTAAVNAATMLTALWSNTRQPNLVHAGDPFTAPTPEALRIIATATEHPEYNPALTADLGVLNSGPTIGWTMRHGAVAAADANDVIQTILGQRG